MIDIIIIIAWIAVVLKIVLKVFQWFEERFHVYGKKADLILPLKQEKTQTVDETKTQQNHAQKEAQKQQPSTQKVIKSTKSIGEEKTKYEPVPIPSENKPLKTQEQKPSETLIDENLQQEQKTQKMIPEQISAALIQASNIQTSEPQRTFTAPIIEINLPPQDQYTNESLVEQNQELRQLYTQSQKLRQKEFNELNQYIEKLKSDKNKYSEKLIGAVQDYQNQKEQNKVLSQKVEELKNALSQKVEEIKAKYEMEISQLKQKLIEQQQNISKQQSTTLSVQSSQQLMAMKSRLEEMKNQLEFSQSQLQQAYQSETKMRQEIEKLRAQSQSRLQQIEKLRAQSLAKLKTRPQVSISDIINHPEYVRVKEKLQRYESGAMGGSGIRSVIQRNEYTPQGERLSKGLDSRVSERRSFISTRYNAESTISGEEEVFSECNFLSPENKHFLLDQIKKIKKLPIKKTKLLFKLDKLHPTNPHQNIDNIPNIVLLIELTNKKILAAFTQTAFNKQDSSIIGDKSLISRSRYGSNKSLIVDLTNKISLSNTRSTDTIIYDENAIVWGKDQLIIKNDEPTILYSSFGTQEGAYWDGKYTLEELLGGSQGFERISQYEFYRIYIG